MMLTSLKNELDLHDYHLQYNVLEKRKLQKKSAHNEGIEFERN